MLEGGGIVRSDLTSSLGDACGTADGVPIGSSLTLTDAAGGEMPFARGRLAAPSG